jgi:hypothetical protein
MGLPRPLLKIFSILLILIFLLTLGLVVPYYNEVIKLIQRSDYALLETPLIHPITSNTLYISLPCTPRLKIAIPKNFVSEKSSGIDTNESCLLKETTPNFLHQKSITIIDHSNIWKAKADTLKESIITYNGFFLKKDLSEFTEIFSKERNYFLKTKLLHDFFQSHSILIYFSKPLITLKSLTGFDLNSKEVYFQKANDNFLVRTSGERKLPHQENFEIFLKNNTVLNVRFNNFEKKEIDMLIAKWVENGVELIQPQQKN